METKQTPPLSPPLAKVAAEFSLSGNIFNSFGLVFDFNPVLAEVQ
jgi:hypothetical protein